MYNDKFKNDFVKFLLVKKKEAYSNINNVIITSKLMLEKVKYSLKITRFYNKNLGLPNV